ncbi:hypothetical protein [Parvibaculum sp.]|uniref:hypothetical protein n=1 Tax=Parvibaculum sp. TaxID=2024848 RepID=UPI0026338412|nr:hypothetical protein [Parvibaculum sp.]MCW5726226.1 hypothetical protein [Parvibaculum sp.]
MKPKERDTAISSWPSERGVRKTFITSEVRTMDDNQLPVRTTSTQQVAEMRERLGILDKLRLDRQSKAEARKVVSELVVNLLEKQKQELLFKATLELSDEKKRAFAESMREGSLIEKEIVERSTKFERELIDFALDQAIEGHQEKKRRLDHLNALHAADKIDGTSFQSEQQAIERWAELFRDNLDAKIELMLRNHAQTIEKALAIFRERVIQGKVY